MTVLDKVRDFIKARSPDALCEDYIAGRLGLIIRQHANRKTRELAWLTGGEACAVSAGRKSL